MDQLLQVRFMKVVRRAHAQEALIGVRRHIILHPVCTVLSGDAVYRYWSVATIYRAVPESKEAPRFCNDEVCKTRNGAHLWRWRSLSKVADIPVYIQGKVLGVSFSTLLNANLHVVVQIKE